MPSKFNPPSELVDFAERISKEYKILKASEYRSERGNYAILYVDKLIVDTPIGDVSQKTPARIGLSTYSIELSKENLIDNPDYTEDFVFYLVLWSFCSAGLLKLGFEEPLKEADVQTMEYYLTTGRSKKNFMTGFCAMTEIAPSRANIDRLVALEKRLSEKQ